MHFPTALLLSLLLLAASVLAADQKQAQIQEQVLHCRGIVSLAKALAQDSFKSSFWSLGEVTATDAGTEDYRFPGGLPGELCIRRVRVMASPMPWENNGKYNQELQFFVKGEPYVKDAFLLSGGTGSWRFVRLKNWRWYDMPGLLVFHHAAEATDEKAFVSPCKLPRPWAAGFSEAASLRQQRMNWFSSALPESELTLLKNEATATTQPLWRLCLACRLLELKKLRPEDVQKLLKAAAGAPLEFGALAVLLFNDTVSHEDEMVQEVTLHGRTPGTAEGLALGCLISAADRRKPLEAAFKCMAFLKAIESKEGYSMDDKEKMIDAAFSEESLLAYRVALRLNLRLAGANDDLRQNVESILFFMLLP